MSDRATRLRDADALWTRADAASHEGDLVRAHALCEAAHDRVTDVAWAHREAHRRLLPLDEALGHVREARTDRLLEALAPVSFVLLAGWFRLTARYDRLPAPT